jgi:hypothetical protein
MLKANLEQRFRCVNHPHRPGERMCARCKTRFCAECFPATDPTAICDKCANEVADIELERHPPMEVRVERAKSTVRTWLVGLLVIAVLAVPGFFVVRNLMDNQLTPEELARFRYAMAGSFETPEGLMVYSTVLGGRVVSATSEAPPNNAARLIDEYWGDGFVGWHSAGATFPQEIVIEAPNPSTIQKVIFAQSPLDPPATYVRAVEVLISNVSPTEDFVSAGRFELTRSLEPQRFEFPPIDGRWVMIRILSNHGSSEYTSLHEADAFFVPNRPADVTPLPEE